MGKSNQLSSKTSSLVVLWGLLVIAFFRPLISGMVSGWSNTYSQVLILFLLASWLLGMTVKGELVFRRTLLDIPILLFSLSLVISIFTSVNKDVSFNQLYQFLSYPVLYFLIVNNLGEEPNPRQGTALILSFSLTVALAVTAWLRSMGMPLIIVLFPVLAAVMVSIPLLRRFKAAGDENVSVHSMLPALILAVAVLVSLYGITQRFWGLEQARQMLSDSRLSPSFAARLGTNKVFSTFIFPPALAGYLLLIIPLALTLFIYAGSGWRRVLPGFTLIVGVPCLYFTYSKGGWLSFILSMAFLAFILGRKHRRLLLILFLVVIGAFLVLVLSGALPYVDLREFTNSFRVRVGYWEAGLGMLRDYPLFGSGLGTFGSLYSRYKLVGAGETQLAHNNYLQIWIETGILGIISFLWLWAAFLRAGWRNIKGGSPVAGFQLRKGMVIGCYVGVAAFLLHSLVDFDLYVQGIATYVWLFVGMVMVAGQEQVGAGRHGQARVISYKLTNSFIRIVMVIAIVFATVFMMTVVSKPLAAERNFLQSSLYLSSGSVEKAIELVNRAIRLNPRKGVYYYRLGSIYQKQGLLDKAISQYRKAVERNPFMPHYHSILGKVLWDKAGGRDGNLMDMAVKEFEKARDLYPTKARYHLLLGRVYELRGRNGEAIREYQKALELDPSLEGIGKRIEDLKGK